MLLLTTAQHSGQPGTQGTPDVADCKCSAPHWGQSCAYTFDRTVQPHLWFSMLQASSTVTVSSAAVTVQL